MRSVINALLRRRCVLLALLLALLSVVAGCGGADLYKNSSSRIATAQKDLVHCVEAADARFKNQLSTGTYTSYDDRMPTLTSECDSAFPQMALISSDLRSAMPTFGYGQAKDAADTLASRYREYLDADCPAGYTEHFGKPRATTKDKQCTELSLDVRGAWIMLISQVKEKEGLPSGLPG